MKNIQPLMKRVGAYLIDILIVMALASLVSSIPSLNKNMEDYQKTYQEYETKYNKHSEYLNLLKTSYEDEEINEEEYNKLIENEKYQDIITKEYDDKLISKGEYKEIVKKLNEEFDKTATDYVYILNKKGISNSIITLICMFLYFGIIQYFLKGETVGKKILKLKVVSASGQPLTILNYSLRTLIVNNVLINAIGVIFLAYSSKKVYLQANNILNLLTSIVEALIIFYVLSREDQRGLHDLLCNTKVISTVSVEEPKEIDNKNNKKQVIEAVVLEEKTNLEPPKKSNTKNKPTNKSNKTNKSATISKSATTSKSNKDKKTKSNPKTTNKK